MTDLLRGFRIRENGSKDKNFIWANGMIDLPEVGIGKIARILNTLYLGWCFHWK